MVCHTPCYGDKTGPPGWEPQAWAETIVRKPHKEQIIHKGPIILPPLSRLREAEGPVSGPTMGQCSGGLTPSLARGFVRGWAQPGPVRCPDHVWYGWRGSVLGTPVPSTSFEAVGKLLTSPEL